MGGGTGAGRGGSAARAPWATSIIAITMMCACRPPPAAALWLGGDVHLGAAPRGGLADIRAMVGDAVGVVNLEGPIGPAEGGALDRGGGRIELTNPASTGTYLAGFGVGAVSLVNNHAGDHGEAGRARTAATLAAAGIAVAAPTVSFEVEGTMVTLLAYDVGAPASASLADEIARAPGIRVVSLHVTGPPSYLPTDALRDAVDRAVTAGADVIVAHGTHALGPVERRGDTVIAWGLGNLLFDCPCTDGREALVLRVALQEGLPAEVLAVRAGLQGDAARMDADEGVWDLVDAISPRPVVRRPGWGRF